MVCVMCICVVGTPVTAVSPAKRMNQSTRVWGRLVTGVGPRNRVLEGVCDAHIGALPAVQFDSHTVGRATARASGLYRPINVLHQLSTNDSILGQCAAKPGLPEKGTLKQKPCVVRRQSEDRPANIAMDS